jgi:hypothetical protein
VAEGRPVDFASLTPAPDLECNQRCLSALSPCTPVPSEGRAQYRSSVSMRPVSTRQALLPGMTSPVLSGSRGGRAALANVAFWSAQEADLGQRRLLRRDSGSSPEGGVVRVRARASGTLSRPGGQERWFRRPWQVRPFLLEWVRTHAWSPAPTVAQHDWPYRSTSTPRCLTAPVGPPRRTRVPSDPIVVDPRCTVTGSADRSAQSSLATSAGALTLAAPTQRLSGRHSGRSSCCRRCPASGRQTQSHRPPTPNLLRRVYVQRT